MSPYSELIDSSSAGTWRGPWIAQPGCAAPGKIASGARAHCCVSVLSRVDFDQFLPVFLTEETLSQLTRDMEVETQFCLLSALRRQKMTHILSIQKWKKITSLALEIEIR